RLRHGLSEEPLPADMFGDDSTCQNETASRAEWRFLARRRPEDFFGRNVLLIRLSFPISPRIANDNFLAVGSQIEVLRVISMRRPPSRYGENKRTCHCSIFSMCIVHNFLQTIQAATNSSVNAIAVTSFDSTRLDRTPGTLCSTLIGSRRARTRLP